MFVASSFHLVIYDSFHQWFLLFSHVFFSLLRKLLRVLGLISCAQNLFHLKKCKSLWKQKNAWSTRIPSAIYIWRNLENISERVRMLFQIIVGITTLLHLKISDLWYWPGSWYFYFQYNIFMVPSEAWYN